MVNDMNYDQSGPSTVKPVKAGPWRALAIVAFAVTVVLGSIIVLQAVQIGELSKAPTGPQTVALDLGVHSTGTRGTTTVDYADRTHSDLEPLSVWAASSFGTGVPAGGTVTITVVVNSVTGVKKADQVTECNITPHPAYLNDDNYEGEGPLPYVTKTLHGKGTIICAWTNR